MKLSDFKKSFNELKFINLGSGWYKNEYDTIRVRWWKDDEIDFWFWTNNDDENQIHFRGKIYTIEDIKWVFDRCFNIKF